MKPSQLRVRERNKLTRTVFEFASQMLEKLHQKMDEGYRGWSEDEDEMRERLVAMLGEHADRASNGGGSQQWVDVANFAMMLWAHDCRYHNGVFAAPRTEPPQ